MSFEKANIDYILLALFLFAIPISVSFSVGFASLLLLYSFFYKRQYSISSLWKVYRYEVGFVFLFLMFIFLSVVFADKKYIARYKLFNDLIQMFVIFIPFMLDIDYKRLFRFLICAAIIGGVWQILQAFSIIEGFYNGRAPGFLDYPNYTAPIIAASLIFLFYYVFRIKRTRVLQLLILSIGFFVLLVGLLLTKTRASWVAFALSVVVYFSVVFVKAKKPLLIVILFILLSIFSWWIYRSGEFATRVKTITNIRQSITLSGRVDIWKSAFSIIKDYPLFGSGAESFAHYYKVYFVKGIFPYPPDFIRHAHNDYIQIAATSGIISGILFILFVLYMLYIAITNIKYSSGEDDFYFNLSLFSVLLLFVVNGLGDYIVFNASAGWLYWLVVGIIIKRWHFKGSRPVVKGINLPISGKFTVVFGIVGLLFLFSIYNFNAIRRIVYRIYIADRWIMFRNDFAISDIYTTNTKPIILYTTYTNNKYKLKLKIVHGNIVRTRYLYVKGHSGFSYELPLNIKLDNGYYIVVVEVFCNNHRLPVSNTIFDSIFPRYYGICKFYVSREKITSVSFGGLF